MVKTRKKLTTDQSDNVASQSVIAGVINPLSGKSLPSLLLTNVNSFLVVFGDDDDDAPISKLLSRRPVTEKTDYVKLLESVSANSVDKPKYVILA